MSPERVTRRYVGKPAYFRLDLTYEANLKLRGEKVTGKGKTWGKD
jgi:hypothetical protein